MTVIDRFLKLVSYPTTSDERSETCPSTPQQRVLAEELVRQMQEMGIADAHVDADGYVYGTIPANCEKDIPVYGLIAHMDTAPDAPGENIRARVTEAYDGGDVVLNEEKNIVLSPAEGISAAEKRRRQAPDRHRRHDAPRRGRQGRRGGDFVRGRAAAHVRPEAWHREACLHAR